MKKTLFPTLLAAMVATVALCGGCADNSALPSLNMERAIDNPRTFDLGEIAESIEFIPLDGTSPDALVGEIRSMDGSDDRFYIQDFNPGPVKIFDSRGRFLTTRGSIGRGPDELVMIGRMTLDRERDNLYLDDWGWGIGKVRGYSPDGEIIARHDSTNLVSLTFLKDKFFGVEHSYVGFSGDNDPPVGEKSVLLTTMTPELRPVGTFETVDKGAPRVFLPGNMIRTFPRAFVSHDGEMLVVKEFRSDTVYHLADGERLRAAYILDGGRHAIPQGAFGESATVAWNDDYHVVNLVREDNRYIFVETLSGRPLKFHTLVFDRDDPSGGFSATGADGTPGLFIDGMVFNPHYLHRGQLVGYVDAIDIVDNAASITDPKLKALAATLREDSNPVIVVANLKQ